MRNKSSAYPLWGLLGLLLLATAILLTARPSGAADTDTTLNCYSSSAYYCKGEKQEIEVTFKASFVEPSCEVTVPTQITLPDAIISDFLASGGGSLNLLSSDGGGSPDIYTNFDITLAGCEEVDQDIWPTMKLVFTDLGTTTGTTGIFAADAPPRDDVGFVIFSTNGETVDNVLTIPPKFKNDGIYEGLAYHFKARMQVYPNVTSITPGPVVGSVSVVANYE